MAMSSATWMRKMAGIPSAAQTSETIINLFPSTKNTPPLETNRSLAFLTMRAFNDSKTQEPLVAYPKE
jgi:hypothetical protein